MERMTPHIGIEPGAGLVGRFGDTVVLIPRGTPGTAGGARQPEKSGASLVATTASLFPRT